MFYSIKKEPSSIKKYYEQKEQNGFVTYSTSKQPINESMNHQKNLNQLSETLLLAVKMQKPYHTLAEELASWNADELRSQLNSDTLKKLSG